MSGSKRTREEEEDAGRNWRDAHLDPPRRSTHRPEGRDSRKTHHNAREIRESYRSRGGQTDRGRRGHESQAYSRRVDDRGETRDKSSPSQHLDRTSSNGRNSLRNPASQVSLDTSEKEEGEISPRPPPKQARLEEPGRGDEPKPLESPTSQLEPELELLIPPSPPPVEDILAERRRKREAILAKYSQDSTPNTESTPPPTSYPHLPSLATNGLTRGPSPGTPVLSSTRTALSGIIRQNERANSGRSDTGTPGVGSDAEDSPLPTSFSLAKGETEEIGITNTCISTDQSAADYDPSMDRREDEERRVARNIAEGIGERLEPETKPMDVEPNSEEYDSDDMFAVASGKSKRSKLVAKDSVLPVAPTAALNADTAADPEGYYQIILGEVLDSGRYQVFSSLGKGMFSAVVRARVIGNDSNVGSEVAIKIIRCQETMYKAGLKEVQILNKLAQADPHDKKHIIRLERTFEHRGHLCLVFESLNMNLREVIKRFGKDVGLNIRAVRAYAHQLFLALSLLRKCNVMHADIKPDNILVNEQKTLLKVCDLGSASDVSESEITPYLVSRFYRAPEIILGHPYDASIDIWSIGCTLYELYTGKILFPGRTNNQMLLFMMELRGRFNSKMVKKSKFGDVHFEENGSFISVEMDRISGKEMIRKVFISKPTRDLRSRLLHSATGKMTDEESQQLFSFVDLLEKCLTLDPSRRITPKDALLHPFVRG